MAAFDIVEEQAKVVRAFVQSYGLTVVRNDVRQLVLSGDGVRLVWARDPRQTRPELSIYCTACTPERRYVPGYMRHLRSPDWKAALIDRSLSLPEQSIAHIAQDVRFLSENFRDVVHGDFRKLDEIDGYTRFASDIESLWPVAMQLPTSDPIHQKYMSGDWSWIDDLKDRLGKREKDLCEKRERGRTS